MRQSVAISAGEASGDLNGAHLAAELKKLKGDLDIWGAGGRRMSDAGVRIVVSTTGGGTIGILQSFRKSPSILAWYFRLRSQLLRTRPDLFIPIDFGAFNIRLAQIAHKRGIPVVYYFPPSSWRTRPRNAKRLLACGGNVVTPFQWSAELLSAEGVNARFVGHPLVDIVRPVQEKTPFFNYLGLVPSALTIGLLPGSRAHELREHLGPMVGSARILRREISDVQFVVAVQADSRQIVRRVDELAGSGAGAPPIRVVEGRTYDCLAHCDFLIAASGTATLEAAIAGTPMLIVYRGTPLMRFEFIFRKAILEGYFGMPNIIAGRLVCPELLNEQVTAETIAEVTLGMLLDKPLLESMRAGLAEVRARLGEPGAVERAARAIVEMGGL